MAWASDIAPTSALKVKIALDLAACLISIIQTMCLAKAKD